MLEDLRDIDDKSLYEIAEKAISDAYAPYSGYRVGAALLSEEGKVYVGVNIENISYGATICAERSALGNAVSDGARTFSKIAIAAEEGEACPCGICRQALIEFSPDMRVVTRSSEGKMNAAKLSDMLPHAFSPRTEAK